MLKKAVSGNFNFLLLSKVMTNLVKRAVCQDRNQTSHQNFLTPFLREGCEEDIHVAIPAQIQQERKLVSAPL